MTCSAVVVAYQSADVIGDCVRSLLDEGSVDEVVVANNSPGDGLFDAIPSDLRVRVFDMPGNLGFGRANNAASRLLDSTTDFVVLANPDTRCTPGTVRAAISFLDKTPAAGVVGTRMIFPDGKPYVNSQRELTLPRMIGSSLRLPWPFGTRQPSWRLTHTHQTPYIIGSFMVARRRALDTVEWFDESIFLFGEDSDLCRRLRRAGYEVWYLAEGEVVHFSGHSWRQLNRHGQRLFEEARERELRRSRGPISAAMYRQLVRVSRRLEI